PRLNGYYERKPIHLIKLAMIVAVSHRDGTQILPSDVTEAMGIMEDAEQHMPAVFANVGKNPLSVDIEEIQKAIFSHAKEGLGIGDLMGMFKHSVRKDELVEVLDALNIMGRIVIRPVGDPPHQRMKYFPS
ncbi:hypothetical protein UFOVP825_1, partial [uncultured Caudovirales phage]